MATRLRLGLFFLSVVLQLVLLQCSTCGTLSSSLCFSRRLPLRRTPAPRIPRLRSPVGDVSHAHCSFLPAHLSPGFGVADPDTECTPYYYAPTDQFIQDFPEVWTPATLLANDAEGKAVWANISSSIPTNIQPKGQLNDSTANETYDCVADPDCCKLLFRQICPIRG
jgi:hypothetical protein